MEQIIDFILVAASGAAIFYCVTLSRRLEKLKCAEMDLGSAIASLSGIVDKANRAVADAAANSDRSARELAPLLEQTRKAIPELGELIDIVSELTEITKAELDEAGDEFDRRLSNKMRSADRIITELSTLTASAARSGATDWPSIQTRGPARGGSEIDKRFTGRAVKTGALGVLAGIFAVAFLGRRRSSSTAHPPNRRLRRQA